MKKTTLILIGVICAFDYSVKAEDATVAADATGQLVAQDAPAEGTPATPAAENPVNSEMAVEAPATTGAGDETLPAETPEATNESEEMPKDAKKKSSWWDSILKLFKIAEPKRTTEEAFNQMVKSQNVVIDFSNVSDFAQNGDAKMKEYYDKIKSTKSFGSKSPNLYVNLSNTGVSTEFVAKWAGEFSKDKKNVIWNLSGNKDLDDSVIDAIDLPSTYSLNLSGTSVTDTGAAKIGTLVESAGLGNLVCVHLSGSKVTDTGVEALKASMQKGLEAWKAKNPGKEKTLQGSDNSGVVFEKVAKIPGAPKGKKAKRLKMNAPAEGTPAEQTAEMAAPEATEPTLDASVEQAQAAIEESSAPEAKTGEGTTTPAESNANAALEGANEAIANAGGTAPEAPAQ